VNRSAPLISALLALAATLAVAAGALALGGHDPALAFRALVRGAFGSPTALLSVTLVRTVPLLLTGLAVALAFRAGVWNIGAEGQLYAGAAAAVWFGLAAGALPPVLAITGALGAAGIAGALWAGLPAWMRLRLGIGEVITTLLLNFVAIQLAAWLVHGPLQEARGVFPQTDAIAESARLPMLVSGTRLHLGFGVGLIAAVSLWGLLRFTRAGFMIRAIGGSESVASTSGRIAVGRTVAGVFLASGLLAGLAGGIEVTGVTHALYENLSPGHGYTAIAVALLAGLHPLGVVLTAMLFGALEAGASAMQRSAGVPAAWVNGIQALVILSVLAVDRGLRRLRDLRTEV
jgi:simple sugar transport system permease protein